MKKLLLAVLAVAAVAVVAAVIVENTPERRMERRLDKLLRTYEDDPKQLFKQLVDDRDLLGFVLVESFLLYNGLDRCGCGARTLSFSGLFLSPAHKDDCDYRTYLTEHLELFVDFHRQIQTELCDCETAPLPPPLFPIIEENAFVFSGDLEVVLSGDRVVFFRHPEDCNLSQASRDIGTTWGSYIRRKRKEFQEAQLNR